MNNTTRYKSIPLILGIAALALPSCYAPPPPPPARVPARAVVRPGPVVVRPAVRPVIRPGPIVRRW